MEEFQREFDTNGKNADLSDGLSHFTVCSTDLNVSRRMSPQGAFVLGAPQVADSIPAPSLFLFVISPVRQTQTQKQGLNVSEVHASLDFLLSTSYYAEIKICRTTATGAYATGRCMVCAPWRNPWRSISHSAVDSRQLFNGQLHRTVLPPRGRNAANHTFALGVK